MDRLARIRKQTAIHTEGDDVSFEWVCTGYISKETCPTGRP